MDVYETYSSSETENIAYKLGKNAKAGDIVCLSGDLGTGKTVFSKGFARGLGIEETITSPTFTIMNQYEGRLTLYHFDVYRLAGEDDMEDAGCEDFFYSGGVCLVEWAELAGGIIPRGALWVRIEKDLETDCDYRRISVERK